MDLKEKQIIYVDNKPHIKCGVIMLSTDKKASFNNYQLCIDTEGHYRNKLVCIHQPNLKRVNPQHIYITSDEEIKKDDWYLDTQTKEIKQYIDTSRTNSENILWNSCKKIIATTNSKLSTTSRTEIPQPSPKFIEKYIEEYNKGNQITEVLVEVEINYEQNLQNTDRFTKEEDIPLIESASLKLDSQNQITIRKQKDNWNKEEVIKLIDKLGYDLSPLGGRNEYSKIKSKWIKENL